MKWLTVLMAVIVLAGCRGKQKSGAPAPMPVPEVSADNRPRLRKLIATGAVPSSQSPLTVD